MHSIINIQHGLNIFITTFEPVIVYDASHYRIMLINTRKKRQNIANLNVNDVPWCTVVRPRKFLLCD